MIRNYYGISSYLKNNIDNFKEIVSNEFINYYGKDYKNEIISRLNDTNYVIYVNTNLYPSFSFPSNINNCGKNNYNDLKKEFKKLITEIIKNNYDNNIYISNDGLFPLKKIINSNWTCLDCYNEVTDKIEKIIYVPLFIGNDESLIHEMIHSIMTTPICFTNIEGRRCVFKTGLCLFDSTIERLIEECITEIEAKIIYEQVHNKYEYLDKFYPLYKHKCMYDKFIPFVIEFYNKYTDEINYSRLTLNKNNIVSIIGKDRYNKYLSLLNEHYSNLSGKHYANKENKLIKMMNKN